MDLKETIRTIPDFPKPGIQFRDITTLLLCPDAFRYVIDTWHDRYRGRNLTAIVAADARGFVFAGALAHAMNLKLALARKKGKLPGRTIVAEYTLEYASSAVEMHVDALTAEDRVVIVDDLLATGGTVAAIASLVRQLGAEIEEVACVVELPELGGRTLLGDVPFHALVEFEGD